MKRFVAALAAFALLASFPAPPAGAAETRLVLAHSTLRLSEFPYPFEDLTGAIVLSSGVWSLDPLQFRVFDSPFSASGWFADGTKRDLTVRSRGVLPADLARILPDLPYFRAVSPVTASVRFERDGAAPEQRRFRFAAERFRVDASEVAKGLGTVEGGDLSATAWKRGKELVVENLSFTVFGGRFVYSGRREEFRASLKRARLGTALAAFPNLAGKVRGRLTVAAARRGDAVDGSFHVSDGSVRDLKFIAALARATGNPKLTSLAVSEFSADFSRRGATTLLNNLVLKSDIAELAANARVDDRALSGEGRLIVRLKVIADGRKGRKLGFLKKVLAKNSLTLKVRLGGTIDDPDLDVRL